VQVSACAILAERKTENENGRLEPFSLPAIRVERTRPAAELLARIPLDDVSTIVDLGCGPGNSTALLKHRWPSAHITGVDNSPAMLEEARSAHA
jgi:trans-aconitate methyltransferase